MMLQDQKGAKITGNVLSINEVNNNEFLEINNLAHNLASLNGAFLWVYLRQTGNDQCLFSFGDSLGNYLLELRVNSDNSISLNYNPDANAGALTGNARFKTTQVLTLNTWNLVGYERTTFSGNNGQNVVALSDVRVWINDQVATLTQVSNSMSSSISMARMGKIGLRQQYNTMPLMGLVAAWWTTNASMTPGRMRKIYNLGRGCLIEKQPFYSAVSQYFRFFNTLFNISNFQYAPVKGAGTCYLTALGFSANYLDTTRLFFDNFDDRVICTVAAINSVAFTIEAIVAPYSPISIPGQGNTNNANAFGGSRLLLTPFNSISGRDVLGLSVGTNGVALCVYGSGSIRFAPLAYTGTINLGDHIAITVTSRLPRLYINGTLVATGVSLNNDPSVQGIEMYSRSSLAFGTQGGAGNCFVKNFRLWTIARTQAEIDATKAAVVVAGTNGLYLQWEMTRTSPQSNTVNDSSGNNRTGTLVNYGLTSFNLATIHKLKNANYQSLT